MENTPSYQEIFSSVKPKPNYYIGLLGLIPLVGFFVGLVLTILGIVKYKDKYLVLIGILSMLFTIAVYSSLYYIGFKSDLGAKSWETHAQMQLNSLVTNVEFYKLEYEVYPDSLKQIENSNQFISIIDPTQSTKGRKNQYYNYKNLGDHYLLFSSGSDGLANTKDDIYPQIKVVNKNIGWIKKELTK
ncbi:MAG: hypothetical protein WCP57_10400 [Bacteroidota bacterium]